MNDHQAGLKRFLSRLLLRSSLSVDEQRAVMSLPGKVIDTPAHRDIVEPGDIIHDATLVIDGIAGRFDQLADGHRQITALHLPGDMCDLHSVAVPHAGWGIESLSPTRISSIPHEAIRKVAVDYPGVGFAFWRDTVVDGSVLAKWLSALGRRSAKSRLAHLICEMGIRLELNGQGDRRAFPLPLTQSQLGDVLGVTPVHLNRSLQALRQDELVAMNAREVRIIDREGLEHVAEFDPEYLLLDRQDKYTGGL